MESGEDLPFGMADIWLRRELIAAGWNDRAIGNAMKSGLVHRIRHGAYVDQALWGLLGGEPAEEHRARARAVLRTAHPASVLTHQSALAEYGVPLWRLGLDEVAITRTDGVAGRNEAGIRHHSGAIPLEHLTVRHGVPVSTAARAAIEVLSTTDSELGFCLLNGLLHAGHTNLEAVERVAAQTAHWPNSLATGLAVGLASPKLTSIAESRALFMFSRHRIPMPEPQVKVYDEYGNLVGIVDFLWKMQETFLEIDGKLKYLIYRRPGETLEQYLMREKKRQERIVHLTGWLPVRMGWSDLEHPQITVRRLRAILDKRTPRAA